MLIDPSARTLVPPGPAPRHPAIWSGPLRTDVADQCTCRGETRSAGTGASARKFVRLGQRWRGPTLVLESRSSWAQDCCPLDAGAPMKSGSYVRLRAGPEILGPGELAAREAPSRPSFPSRSTRLPFALVMECPVARSRADRERIEQAGDSRSRRGSVELLLA